MAILLLADHDNSTLSEQTARVVNAASQIGGDIHVLVAGAGCDDVGRQAARLDGVTKVLLAEAEHLQHHLAEQMADLIIGIADDYDGIISAATTTGKNVMPRVAALLDVMQISDIIAIHSADRFERPIYAGNAMQTVSSTDAKQVITVRTTGFDMVDRNGSASIETIDVPADSGLSKFVNDELSSSERPELTSAKIIISGGRALGSADQFEQVIMPVANKLGAAVGASRAAVDAGYAPNDWQVGQTGKVVAPDLYIACGISGAIQHLAGMKDSKIIVAINKDEEAPIFQVADYGLVADLFEALPMLEKALD